MTPSGTNDGWDQIGPAVRELKPEVPELTVPEQIALWERIEAGEPVFVKRRRLGWKAAVAGVVAVVAVGTAGAATAGVFSAHSGKGPVDAEDIELGGPGERLDPRAPDFVQVIDEETADIRFPSSQARDQAVTWESKNYDGCDNACVSTGAIRLWTAGHAICSWTNQWAAAVRTSDVVVERNAAEVILAARTWPAITDTDPDMADESEFAWLPDLERAIRAGDIAGARKALQPNQSCMPGLAPELGLGRAW